MELICILVIMQITPDMFTLIYNLVDYGRITTSTMLRVIDGLTITIVSPVFLQLTWSDDCATVLLPEGKRIALKSRSILVIMQILPNMLTLVT